MNRQLADYAFNFIVNYTLNQANTNQPASQIYQQFQRGTVGFFVVYTIERTTKCHESKFNTRD
ncbi:hypothetical protein SAMN05421676_103124 [Salinibacillus kushneri]|uniref:Uncharacterized protein n=1 Tax=Salinibacillus kushneri TaxID=237682 RepID=A0A1I0CE30_9BACI|nr:hypothetical protein [Salinibacillus kushneri]SET17358.1 hypothetical protein SAMN05421676_103124 [Salinibacillus kushneri]